MSGPGPTTSDREAAALAAARHPITAARSTGSWIVVLGGPLVWFGHFMAVYLLAEASCELALLEGEVAGQRVLSVAILGLTAVAVVPVLVVTSMAWRRWRYDDDPGLAFVGVLLGLLFTLAILAVGLPALVLDPC